MVAAFDVTSGWFADTDLPGQANQNERSPALQSATKRHDGQISQNLSSPSRKNILLSFSRKSPA
ncbi:hypothetical protein KIP88_30085 [Bradyrhizobium sp. SRL28]|jgi:hypothetical protein|uniref:hypothetical protein n=1 Tax=Bradyrhizobium sp. SRL28 TaxID=2836178 RepID=UPI001BDF2B88|nr:hypothetical protein [Bradyrhizobium sp. SRL28]MBT1514745.1 hypothetical protein [Bradyrhizobium sp. SRL28]